MKIDKEPAVETAASTPGALRAMLSGIVDYGGLFPPARLDMATTVANYARYLAGPDAWMLGRLVIPAERLDEFDEHARPHLPTEKDAEPWQLAALVAPAGDPRLAADLERVAGFNALHAGPDHGGASIAVIELKPGDASAVDDALDAIPDDWFPFFELPAGADPRGLIAALAGSDAGAKIRTGGLEPAAFPSPQDVARFIAGCRGAGVPFKATAGLHHVLRHRNGAIGADEFGFLNVFVAAALAFRAKLNEAALREILVEKSLDAFTFQEHALRWRHHELSIEQIDETRMKFAVSFGSCSFDEPLENLRGAGLA